MIEIGAGGGSIARLDALRPHHGRAGQRRLRAGSGCYGRGGTEPTVTDADLTLGGSTRTAFAGGTHADRRRKAAAALGDVVGAPLRLDA